MSLSVIEPSWSETKISRIEATATLSRSLDAVGKAPERSESRAGKIYRNDMATSRLRVRRDRHPDLELDRQGLYIDLELWNGNVYRFARGSSCRRRGWVCVASVSFR